MPFGLGPGASLWLALALFVAAFVRGYSGFGFAALAVSSAGLVTNPLNLVPVVILADFTLTAFQFRSIRSGIDRRRVLFLIAGALPGVPLGVWAVGAVGSDHARAAISVYVLAMCAVLWSGWTLRRAAGGPAHAGIGVISGIANGAAVGGLPVAAFFAAQPIPAATFRATLIAYFTLLDMWTLPVLGHAGLITRETLTATAMGLPLMMVGVWLGSRHFLGTSPQNFRRFAIVLLAGLACLGLLKSVL
ncbi:MAG: TSUP family transporter [Limimaricola sp.]|uniref:sulfite exporter TauE/SafE family protein n=1 Tax=Limimaricola sp. TaxID=2211665 RepID=UPI001D484BDE|nr:sulfite exporter TauE/SafE family protein [Limimaricola sp.]MBI1417551.1 TSUP family transporter [Limimaricola sp.]